MTNKELESYLTTLDHFLTGVPIGEKSDIITEIKGHCLDALEANPEKSMKEILQNLGDPQTVANRYLAEKGITSPLPPGKRKESWAKWLTIGFLGTFGIVAIFTMFVVWNFSPLIKVDEEKGRVTLLGGLIDIKDDESKGNSNLSLNFSNKKSSHFKSNNFKFRGTSSGNDFKEMKVDFSNGNIKLETSSDQDLHWKCKVDKNHSPQITKKESTLNFQLSDYSGAKCTFSIPQGKKFEMKGANGKVKLDNPLFHSIVNLVNGKIGINLDKESLYNVMAKVNQGYSDSFPTGDPAKLWNIDLQVINGVIKSE